VASPNLSEGVLIDVPDEIRQVLITAQEVEFATMSAKEVPINNPLFHYFGKDGTTIDVATGVAYPAKADRARRNPKVGLLFAASIAAHDPVVKGSLAGQVSAAADAASNADDSPVVVVAATAAVRNNDIQANTDRYVRDFIRDHPLRVPWEVDRERVWYYARLYIECTPQKILYWPKGVSDGSLPVIWTAEAGSPVAQSDPGPTGKSPARSGWPTEDWREVAANTLESISVPTLTLGDVEGYPLPFPTLGARLVDDGFELDLPSVLPWAVAGPACLTFAVSSTFLGAVRVESGAARFTVDRVVGNLPLAGNKTMPGTSPEAKAELRRRLAAELDRYGQPVPDVRLT
jgi:hypothetical protein